MRKTNSPVPSSDSMEDPAHETPHLVGHPARGFFATCRRGLTYLGNGLAALGRQLSAWFNALRRFMGFGGRDDDAITTPSASFAASESWSDNEDEKTTRPKIAWEEPGARRNPSNYWIVYCDAEQILFDYLSEEKEHSILKVRLQLYLNDMTFYLGSAVHTTLCYEPHLASDHHTQAGWLAAALCLHVCRRELQIPWQPDEIAEQLVEQAQQQALRILEVSAPDLAAFASGDALKSSWQDRFVYLESMRVSRLLPIMQEGLHRNTALGSAWAPYLSASNLTTLEDNLAWRAKRSQILRERLHVTKQEEVRARFAAEMAEVQKSVTASGERVADLLEAEIRNNPDFMSNESDRLSMLADCDRMRREAKAVASTQTQDPATSSQDMELEWARPSAEAEGNDEKSDDNAETSLGFSFTGA